MRRLVILRPEPGASATAERARELGLEPMVAPLFEIRPIAWEAPEASSFDALLLTSANAVRVGGDELHKLRGLKAYVVGEATAEAARAAGFDIAATGDAGVDRLLGSIAPDIRLLHLCGEDRRAADDPPQAIAPVVVYRASPIETPDLEGIDDALVLVHSPRAGRRLGELVGRRASIAVAAISPAAAQAVGNGWESVEAADTPSDEALLALAARLCNKPAPQ